MIYRESTGLRNYRRRELQLLLGVSDDEESRSSTSERGQESPLSEEASDQGVNLMEEQMAAKEPGQNSLDET